MRITHVAEMSDPDRGPHARQPDALDHIWTEIAARERGQRKAYNYLDERRRVLMAKADADMRGLRRGLGVVLVLYVAVTVIIVVMNWGAR